MEAYQERVIAEKAELNTKIIALTSFVCSEKFNSVKQEEQKRMEQQLYVMLDYCRVLRERISGFYAINP